jgi:hypothetical protein
VQGVDGPLIAVCVGFSLAEVFYWNAYNAYSSAIGDAEHRGHQLGAREALVAVAGILGPLLGAWALSSAGPRREHVSSNGGERARPRPRGPPQRFACGGLASPTGGGVPDWALANRVLGRFGMGRWSIARRPKGAAYAAFRCALGRSASASPAAGSAWPVAEFGCPDGAKPAHRKVFWMQYLDHVITRLQDARCEHGVGDVGRSG